METTLISFIKIFSRIHIFLEFQSYMEIFVVLFFVQGSSPLATRYDGKDIDLFYRIFYEYVGFFGNTYCIVFFYGVHCHLLPGNMERTLIFLYRNLFEYISLFGKICRTVFFHTFFCNLPPGMIERSLVSFLQFNSHTQDFF